MLIFDLTKNPFWLLRTSIRARQEDILEAFERAVSDGVADENDLLRAQQIILAPRTRLEAELAWLPDLNPARAAKTVALLASHPPRELALQLLDGAEGLTRINLAVDFCSRYSAGNEILTVLKESYKTLRSTDVEEAIDASRTVSGFSRADPRTVATVFRTLQGVHAKAAVKCLGGLPNPGAALTALIDDSFDPDSLQFEFLDAVVREYSAHFDGRLRDIGDSIREALVKMSVNPNGPKELSELENDIIRWSEYSAPIEMWERTKGLTDQRSYNMYKELRDTALKFANQMDEYRAALSITNYLRVTFANLPEVPAQLDEDVNALQRLILDQRVSLAMQALEKAVEQATENLQALQTCLLSSGFGSTSSGVVKPLYDSFVKAVDAGRGTEHSDAPSRMIRSVSVQLNNSDFQQAAETVLTSLLSYGHGSLSAELTSLIEGDIRTVRNNIRWQKLQYLIKTGQKKAALPLLQDSIKDEDPGEGREHLTQLYTGIRHQLAMDDRRNKATLLKWGGGAIFLLLVIAIKSCSSDNSASPSPYASAPASDTSAGPVDATRNPTTASDGPLSGLGPSIESKPPVGTDLALSQSQLRYCQFQHARLARAKALAAGNKEVGYVNVAIDDFNSRCASYRYDEADMTVIQAELQQRKAEIESDAHRLLMKGPVDQ